MKHGSMTHDFSGRKIKKKAPKGEVFEKYTPRPFESMKTSASQPYRRDSDQPEISSVDLGAPTVNAAPERKEYTGTLVTGIATMHKSNAVPVINQEQATEIAQMRRS